MTDETWSRLSGLLDTRELIELVMLVGHYEMLAKTINTLRIQPTADYRGLSNLATRFTKPGLSGGIGLARLFVAALRDRLYSAAPASFLRASSRT